MSYYAKHKGSITAKDCAKASYLGKKIEEELTAEQYHKGETLVIDLEGRADYNEDTLHEIFADLTPYTVEGEVFFWGEDDAVWRYIFRDGEWFEECGEIVYKDGYSLSGSNN